MGHAGPSAQVVLPCADLDTTLAFFTERLGFRLDAIFPADAPRVAEISGHGVRLRLERGSSGSPAVLRLACEDPTSFADGATELTAPNGTRIEIVEADAALVSPPNKPSFLLNRMRDDATWGVGRAGMRYRDLIPDRQGGRFIASHIQIPEGGPVPDYVHYHDVRFQMIYCYKGWVRVAYEDQGAPFIMRPGDCVLQPPMIRHRVLECSDGLEVIEIGCPAAHPTFAEHILELPTPEVRPERDFDGQRFVFHPAADAAWRPGRRPGFECRDAGIAAATDGLAGVQVARPAGARPAPEACRHDGELMFIFVLSGALSLDCGAAGMQPLQAGDAVVVAPDQDYVLAGSGPDLEFLEVALPAF